MAVSVDNDGAGVESGEVGFGYVRVSRVAQADGFSPDVQRAGIVGLALHDGVPLALIEEDHERGSTVTRRGYQRLLGAVRAVVAAGGTARVYVYMWDRWGRDGGEWITRAREFERLGVGLVSVQEGRDEPGLLRFVRAGMAEQYSRDLAKRVMRPRAEAARTGTHMGRTPFGYTRVYPPRRASGRPEAGVLTPDPVTAWVVRELFARYAAGGASTRGLALWLNTDPRVGAPVNGREWAQSTVRDMLRCPTYRGAAVFGRDPIGLYERTAPGDIVTVEDAHAALVTSEVWRETQRRLDAAAQATAFNRTRRPGGGPVALGTGLLRCAACGARMQAAGGRQYNCHARHYGYACREPGYSATPVHAALLDALSRLEAVRWAPQKVDRAVRARDTARQARVVDLRAQLDAARTRLARYLRRLADLENDQTPEERAADRAVRADLSRDVRGLEEELARLDAPASVETDDSALHARLLDTRLADLIAALRAVDGHERLRALLLEFIESACVVGRVPVTRAFWVQVDVTWTEPVRVALATGRLRLREAAPPPVPLTSRERNRANARAWRERQRAKQAIVEGTDAS